MVRPTSKSLRKLTAFTLVELIVVISILAILGTIGLISFSGYQSSARDSVRVSDIKSIQKGLSIFQIKTGFYPLPEDSIEIMAGVSILSYQGYVWDGISRIANANKTPLDPKDTARYTYTIDSTKKKAQLMGYMESGDTVKVTAYNDLFSRLINQSYAAAAAISNMDYKKRVVYVIGDTIGVLTDGNNAPIQESATWTGINLRSVDTTGYVAYFGWDAYGTWQSTGTGDVLIAQMLWAQTNTIPCNPLSYSGYTITALAHNQAQTFTKPLTITNGTGTGSLQIQCQNGTLDTLHAIETNNIGCNTNYVNQAGSCIQDVCGGTVPTSTHSTAISQSVSQNWTRNATPGICTFDCNTNYTWNGTSCVANTQSMSCTGLPSNGVWNTVSSITQTWNGSSWIPSTTGAYNTTASTTSCNYACNTNFHTENVWVSCISNIQSCAIANGVGSQTWNTGTSVWNACTVVSCNSGYTVSGNSCITSSYTVSGWFWVNANGATINVCGTSVTADVSGNFTTTRSSGSVCNTITATRAGYTCTTTTNGPASLAGNFTTVAGSCVSAWYPGCDTPNITLTNGQVWAACNIGTTIAGFTTTSYGSYYQWGRNDTGWTAGWATDNWGLWWQWPCATGYHVPTQPQWQAAYNNLGSNLPNTLKLPKTGLRSDEDGSLGFQGTHGHYWSSTSTTDGYYLVFDSTNILTNGNYFKALGLSVRCLKN